MHNIFEKIEINRRDRLLRAVLKRKGREASEQTTKDAIACILDHEECFEAFAAGLESEYAARPAPFWGERFGNPLTDFLEWIMANWPQILAMIMEIIDLFSKKPDA